MGSYVRRAELGSELPEREPEQEPLDSFDSDGTTEEETEPLGTFLSGRLAGSDIEPVQAVRRLRRRDRE